MKDEQVSADGKKPYEKPEVRVIELSAEEVLAVGCKFAGGGFAVDSPACGLGVNCVLPGS